MKGNWLNNAYVQVLEELGRNDSLSRNCRDRNKDDGTTSLLSYTR